MNSAKWMGLVSDTKRMLGELIAFAGRGSSWIPMCGYSQEEE